MGIHVEGFEHLGFSESVSDLSSFLSVFVSFEYIKVNLTNQVHIALAQRRLALEDWMGRLLADIDISRSVPLASFLELEAAVRAGMF